MADAEDIAAVREELRNAVRQLDIVTSVIVTAIDHAERIIGGQPSGRRLTTIAPQTRQRLQTPANFDAHEDPAFLRE